MLSDFATLLWHSTTKRMLTPDIKNVQACECRLLPNMGFSDPHTVW